MRPRYENRRMWARVNTFRKSKALKIRDMNSAELNIKRILAFLCLQVTQKYSKLLISKDLVLLDEMVM